MAGWDSPIPPKTESDRSASADASSHDQRAIESGPGDASDGRAGVRRGVVARGAGTARRRRRPIRSCCTTGDHIASSATRSPSGCSTTAGSRRCCTPFPEARPGDPQPRLHRRRSRDAAALEELRHARRVAERQGGADRRLRGEPLRAAPTPRPTSSSPSSATTSRSPGEAGLDAFKQQLDDLITHTLAQKYNGKSAPRLVLFSPIAHEDLHNPDLPDGKENNAAARAVHAGDGGGRRRRSDVHVRRPVRAEPRSSTPRRKTPLTINGVHLNERGQPPDRARSSTARSSAPPPAQQEALPRRSSARPSLDKNFHWFNRYRTTDGFSTFGDRAFLTFVGGNPRNVNPTQVQVRQGRRAADQLRGAASARWRSST